ncbi:hypothetical protein ACFY5D_12545 [Paeniglutamicibacter sp. NPDC012692]|uniref:hypothetical protein n=1 Tax=Paeniglutamicibacter sp. NPDC012692 TaxID=3364388 RepID=UPI00367F50EE
MNQTPRLLNRILLGIFGVLLLALGIHLLLIAGVPDYARGWRGLADAVYGSGRQILLATTLPGQKESWLWIIVAALLIVVILLMIWWISVQGRGRTSEYVSAYFDDEPMPGRVEISGEAVEQTIRAMLGRRVDVVSISVSVWERAPVPGLKIKVQPRKGVEPGRLGHEIVDATRAAQELMGARGPVVVYLAAGARSRFARSDRVQ